MSLKCTKKANLHEYLMDSKDIKIIRDCREKFEKTKEYIKLKEKSSKLMKQYDKKLSALHKKMEKCKTEKDKALLYRDFKKNYLNKVYLPKDKIIRLKNEELEKQFCKKFIDKVSQETINDLINIYEINLNCNKKIKNKTKSDKDLIKIYSNTIKDLKNGDFLGHVY